MPNVVMLSVVRLNVIMLTVVAPECIPGESFLSGLIFSGKAQNLSQWGRGLFLGILTKEVIRKACNGETL
jgi:hypothetical protein